MGHRDDGLRINLRNKQDKKQSQKSFFLAVCTLICAYTAPSFAAGWEINPSLVFGETYTDNVLLSETGQQEDYITEISPGVEISKKSRRMRVSFNYRLQNLLFAKDSDRNSTNHNLLAGSNTELVRDHFFLDAFASVSQQIISARETISLDNFNTDANRTDVYSLSLSPYYKHKFGSYMDTLIRTNLDISRYSEGVSDSDGSGIDAVFSSGKYFSTFGWSLRYMYEDYSRTTSSDISSNSIIGDLRYRWLKRLSLLAQLGYERHGFETSRDNGFQNGTYYTAGFEWMPSRYFSLTALAGARSKSTSVQITPSRRTKLQFTWRNRDVGSNPGVSWDGKFTMRTRRTNWNASYAEETTTTQQIEREQFTAFRLDENGNLVAPPTQITVLSLIDEVVFRETARFSVNGKTGKSAYNLALSTDKRSRELSMEVERNTTADVSWKWSFSARSDLNLSNRWQHTQFESDDRKDYARFFDASFHHQLGKDVEGSVGYRRSSRNSSSQGSNYDEDRIQLNVTVRF